MENFDHLIGTIEMNITGTLPSDKLPIFFFWSQILTPWAQNTIQKSISIVFLRKRYFVMIRHSASTVNRNIQNGAHPGGGCFCLLYLLSDESWRIALRLTQKTMEMDFRIVFCAVGIKTRVFISWLTDRALFACVERLELAFKFGFKFPVGDSVPVQFISMIGTSWHHCYIVCIVVGLFAGYS
jgi:hypothetical protein